MQIITIHHVAATGGSIIAQGVASAANAILISEINPSATIVKTPPRFNRTSLVEHCCRSSGRELNDALKFKYFSSRMDICIAHAKNCSKNILLRDHSHSSFNHTKEPAGSDFLIYLDRWQNQADLITQAKSILSIRHPLDSYLSSRKKGWHTRLARTGSFDDYCRSLLAFQDFFAAKKCFTLRYEDFCISHKNSIDTLFAKMQLKPQHSEVAEIQSIAVTGKSGRRSADIHIRPRRLSEIDESLRKEIQLSTFYMRYCEINSYSPEIESFPLMEAV